MIPNPYPGIFIIIDGIDGCGKSTQVRLLVEWLKRETYSAGRVVLETKEPDKTGPFGKMIYADLANEDGLHVTDPARFQMWYACDSKIHLQNKIIPCLEHGGIVISDRFRSSMVYGARIGDDIPGLMVMNQMIIGEHFIWPDAIFIIDVTPEVAIKRLKENGRDMDGHENREVLDRTRGHYMTFFRAYPNCIVIPDSGLVSPDTKSMNIREHVEKLLKQKPACGVQGRTDVSVS